MSDERVSKVLRRHGMEHCCVAPYLFGQESEEEQRRRYQVSIVTNSTGEFIVGNTCCNVKMFYSS